MQPATIDNVPKTADIEAQSPKYSDNEKIECINRIKNLLKEQAAVLVAHYYTDADLQMIADETGGTVSDSLEMARYAAARLTEHPGCELILEPDLSVVLFRRHGWDASDYERWSRRLLESQRAFVTSSGWRGETVGRLVFLHPATTTDMVDEVIAALD